MATRVLQLTDTHLSASSGVPATLQWLLDRAAEVPPDLAVLTGDIVEEDPDDEADRAFAATVLNGLPCPIVAIPGNHDIGFYGEDEERPRRLAAFRDTWGADRFELDVDGWRLVGANAYLLGDADHDRWLAGCVAAERPVAVFIHQPVIDDTGDGWEMPDAAREALAAAIDGADVRLIASGHRHRYAALGRHVWGPSTTIVGNPAYTWSDPRPGAVEYTFRSDGTVAHEVIHIPV